MENNTIENNRKRINIMSSCDDNLTQFIFVQLKTMAVHLRDKEVHFYFFYNRIPEEKLQKLEAYCEFLGNITFHRVFIEDPQPYIELVRHSSKSLNNDKVEREWPFETYIIFDCHKYLPDDIDRILCIDAGDVLFADNIDKFYFDDFEGNSIIISQTICKLDGSYFTKEDLDNPMHAKSIRKGIFNAGVYMVNLDQYRKDNVNMDDIVAFAKDYAEKNPGNASYFADQGLLAIYFIETTKYFDYKGMRDLWDVPYNFTLTFFAKGDKGAGNRPLWYKPVIIHYMLSGPKPWDLIAVFVREGILKIGEGQKIAVDELLEMASTTKKGSTKRTKSHNPDETIIEPGMVPFFRYWFEARDVVANELKEIEERNKK